MNNEQISVSSLRPGDLIFFRSAVVLMPFSSQVVSGKLECSSKLARRAGRELDVSLVISNETIGECTTIIALTQNSGINSVLFWRTHSVYAIRC